MACSGGGHCELLAQLVDSVGDHRRIWLTQRSERANALEVRGERVEYLPEWDRGEYMRGRVLSNLARSIRVALQRPAVVITTGAGLVVPFCILAKALGAKLVFIETPARLHHPSKSGRVLGRFADRVLVQWPSMLKVYPQAVVCMPDMLRAARPRPDVLRSGTVVAVGTHRQPFDRLLRMVDDAVEAGRLERPVTAQGGVSKYVPRSFKVVRYIEPAQMDAAMASARYVVCHGGSGIITAALRAGRRPLVLSRRRALGEHVDDHQADMVNEMVRLGLAVQLDDRGITEDMLGRSEEPLSMQEQRSEPSLGDAIEAEVARLLASPAVDVSRTFGPCRASSQHPRP